MDGRKKNIKFTDRAIKTLKPECERYEIAKDGGGGLRIRVSPKGRKTFVFRFKFQGRGRVMVLGTYPEVTIADVGVKHAEARSLIKKGIDPAEQALAAKKAEIEAETVEELVDYYIKEHAKKNKKSWATDERILKKDLLPAIGRRKVKDVTRRELKVLFSKVAGRAPVQANRLHAVTRKMFNFAIDEELLDANPCNRIKAPSGKEKAVERKLEAEEIRLLWRRLYRFNVSPLIKLAIKFQLVTGQRSGELAGMRWRDISEDWWTIPETKNDLSHRVPLTLLARRIIEHAQRFSSEDRVFPLSDNTVNQAISRNIDMVGIERFTPHDLRRTTATRMASAGVQRLVLAKILNHKDKGVTAIYDQHSYDHEKRQAMELWSRELMSILGYPETGNVVELRRVENVSY